MKTMVKNTNIENYEDLSDSQIFEKVKEQLNPIQKNLTEKIITINEAKDELKKINNWIQGTKLEQKNKKEVGKIFEKLTKPENNIDGISLKNEFNEIIKLLEKSSKKDLANLKQKIKEYKQQWNSERPIETQQGIEESSNNLASTIHDASQDKNPFARKIGEWMKKLIS